jgi:hypothetical protein
MPTLIPIVAGFAESAAGAATIGGIASAGIGYGISQLAKPKAPNIAIPPPPGAAMIDPAGAQAAASQRQRAAAAGGLNSTITGAGAAPPGASTSGPTSGAKTLIGQ